jgi:hypothetical protein
MNQTTLGYIVLPEQMIVMHLLKHSPQFMGPASFIANWKKVFSGACAEPGEPIYCWTTILR